ncbi:hypothetical protein OG596_39285 (plasmid) [Streptomyces sp. NBC_01102]|uniref:hypothetical protein n=1 Tax=unclassified Streptomyces TaxID=2593676 RepID=UPI00288BC095|nr:hypothetical protein [Streptomyces sp. ITFR-6]WNI34639.1 hypothetical protein RLT59_39120 [Streptomyces sp. ITFR-6]WSU71406.1 hypothetical protein OG596_39285 [Streptomyces sp. NBC_01102]
MSNYREERRADAAAQAEQELKAAEVRAAQEREDRRLEVEAQLKAREIKAAQQREDAAAAEERKAVRQREADERAARLAKQSRTDKQAKKKAKQAARAERKAARRQALTPGNVYRTGTLALVTASALGSMPAQILHFAHMSPMLLPLPFAIEGAAWVMAAGVAYADERGLPGWVRWALRGFVLAAAGFAASINYGYGKNIAGLSEADATTAGIGLAAVSLLGPLLFEVRQWVGTLSAKTGTAEEKKRRREEKKAEAARQEHLARRRKHHKDIAEEADRLLSALPLGSITEEEAFGAAWQIKKGTQQGLSAEIFAQVTDARVQLGAAFELGEHVRPELVRAGMLANLYNPLPGRLAEGIPALGPSVPHPALQRSPEGATALAGIGVYGSKDASEKARENASNGASGNTDGNASGNGPRGRSDEELEALLPKALKVAAELVAEGNQISGAALSKRLGIRRDDARRLRDRVIAERKLKLVDDQADAAVGA